MSFFGDLWEGAKEVIQPVVKYATPLLDAGASYFGVPPGTVTAAMNFLNPKEDYEYTSMTGIWDGISNGLSSMMGNAPSSALDFLTKQYTTQQANSQSEANTALAWQRSVDAYNSRYQNTMADMRKAGLNPILAASGGFNVGSAPQASTAQAFAAPPTEIPRATSSALETSSVMKQKAEVEAIQWNIKKTAQDINESVSRIDLNWAKAEQAKDESMRIWQDCKNKVKDIERMNAEIIMLSAKTNQSWQEAEKIDAEKDMMRKQIGVVTEQLKMLQATNKYYEGDFGKLLGLLNALTGAGNISIRR